MDLEAEIWRITTGYVSKKYDLFTANRLIEEAQDTYNRLQFEKEFDKDDTT